MINQETGQNTSDHLQGLGANDWGLGWGQQIRKKIQSGAPQIKILRLKSEFFREYTPMLC